jgi:hypothetical protein
MDMTNQEGSQGLWDLYTRYKPGKYDNFCVTKNKYIMYNVQDYRLKSKKGI